MWRRPSRPRLPVQPRRLRGQAVTAMLHKLWTLRLNAIFTFTVFVLGALSALNIRAVRRYSGGAHFKIKVWSDPRTACFVLLRQEPKPSADYLL